ncbi:hypothetical protein CERZMDRAFT_94129 [Cercospora zeae-maydis SCOH1-5]|uniref:SnoaL-like domain-containing protein n=1 Tax=Cercospora zeae-maydis SCOH1-5 TaxID=717836 RepID=A0A6A6FQM1_9PEZI|nr:hypothetical protein CERZMDRAFT_94129 [Cercospora zeae-maydis SCOH1-5]
MRTSTTLASLWLTPMVLATFSTLFGKNGPERTTGKDASYKIESSLWRAASEGTHFDNPKFECKHKSQLEIYDAFKSMEGSVEKLTATIHPDAHFHVSGHHPLSGIYNGLDTFFVNSMWRLFKTYDDHIDEHTNNLLAISGGCDEEWSTQETVQDIRSNVGKKYTIMTAWVTRWSEGKIVQARVYLDGGAVEELLHDNESWTNHTMDVIREDYIPGPQGLPPKAMLEAMKVHKTDL